MATQLTCDLCGGKLVMRAGGLAVCENCSLEYSMESLREKLDKPQPTVHQSPAESDNSAKVRNKLTQAQSLLDDQNYEKAIECCEAVHDMDFFNQEAWRISILANVYRYLPQGAKVLAQSRKHITNPEIWDAMITELRPSLLSLSLNDYTTEGLKALCDIDASFGLEYLCAVINNCATEQKAKGDEIRALFAEEKKKRPSSVASSNASMITTNYAFQEHMKEMVCSLQYVEELTSYCEQKHMIVDEHFANLLQVMQSFLDDVKKFKTWNGENGGRGYSYTHRLESFLSGSTYYDTRYYEKACKQIKPLWAPIQKRQKALIEQQKAAEKEAQKKRAAEEKAAVVQYWVEHAEEKTQLDKKKADIQAQIAQLKKEKSTLDKNTHGQELANKISALQHTHDSLGIFHGKKKKALQEEIETIRYQLAKWENSYVSEQKRIDAQIKSLNSQLYQVDKSLKYPNN